MNEDVYLTVLTPLSLVGREAGDKVIRLWEKYFPEYLPDKFGNWEPIDRHFDLSKRELILDSWNWPFLAIKSKPKMYADVFMRVNEKIKYARWMFHIQYKDVNVKEIIHSLQEVCKELKAHFGCLTLLTPEEIRFGRKNGTVMNLDKSATKFNFILHSKLLDKVLPDIYWVTVFGEPYVKIFGKERLLSAPVFKAEMIGKDEISLQLTPNMEDMYDNPKAFSDLKIQVKKYLGDSTFFHA